MESRVKKTLGLLTKPELIRLTQEFNHPVPVLATKKQIIGSLLKPKQKGAGQCGAGRPALNPTGVRASQSELRSSGPEFEETGPGFEETGPGFEETGPGFEEVVEEVVEEISDEEPEFEETRPEFEETGLEETGPGFEEVVEETALEEPKFEKIGPELDKLPYPPLAVILTKIGHFRTLRLMKVNRNLKAKLERPEYQKLIAEIKKHDIIKFTDFYNNNTVVQTNNSPERLLERDSMRIVAPIANANANANADANANEDVNDTIGKIPPGLSHFQKLRYLTILNLREFPLEITTLSNLRTLTIINFSFNSFPPEIGNLKKLRFLQLRSTENFTLPVEFGQLENLKILIIDGRLNEFPLAITTLPQLTVLRIRNSSFDSIPPEIGNLKKLKHLHLVSTGVFTLPAEFGQLENLEFFYFSDTITVPPEIGQIPNLRIFYPGSERWARFYKIHRLLYLNSELNPEDQVTETDHPIPYDEFRFVNYLLRIGYFNSVEKADNYLTLLTRKYQRNIPQSRRIPGVFHPYTDPHKWTWRYFEWVKRNSLTPATLPENSFSPEQLKMGLDHTPYQKILTNLPQLREALMLARSYNNFKDRIIDIVGNIRAVPYGWTARSLSNAIFSSNLPLRNHIRELGTRNGNNVAFGSKIVNIVLYLLLMDDYKNTLFGESSAVGTLEAPEGALVVEEAPEGALAVEADQEAPETDKEAPEETLVVEEAPEAVLEDLFADETEEILAVEEAE